MTGNIDPVALLASTYGVTTAAPPERLSGGDWNTVYAVDADGKWVLRVSHERKRQAQLQFELATMASLRKRLPFIPGLRSTIDGSAYGRWQGRFCCLFEFMPGSTLRPSDETAALAGLTLGHIHRELQSVSRTHRLAGDLSLIGFDWHSNYFYAGDPLDVVACGAGLPERDQTYLEEITSSKEYLRFLRADLSRWLEVCQREGLLTEGITHGDFCKRNVLSDGIAVTAVLDWDECITSWTEYEVANAAWEFSRESGQYRVNPRRESIFLSAYCRASQRPALDRRLVDRLTAVRRLIEIQLDLYQLGQGKKCDLGYCVRNVRYLKDVGPE